MKSTVVHSNVLGRHVPHTHSLAHPEQLPVLQAPLMVSALYSGTVFNLLHHIFTMPFLCLDMFGTQILIIVLQLPVAFSTITCCPGSQSRAMGYTAYLHSRYSHLGLCKSTL